MNPQSWRYGSTDAGVNEDRRGALIVPDDKAGVELRRLARKYRIRPDCDHGPELLARLDNRMLRARYVSKRGIGLDEFAELLCDTVTFGRPSLQQVVDLLEWALPSRRLTREEKLAQAAEQLETRNIAAELVAAQQAAVTQFHNRTKRGTKLQAWICDCTRGAQAYASFGVELDCTCNRCGAPLRRKNPLPTLDEAACVAATEDTTDAPF